MVKGYMESRPGFRGYLESRPGFRDNWSLDQGSGILGVKTRVQS